MLSKYFYGWAACAVLVFLAAYLSFVYPDGWTPFNPVPTSSVHINFAPFTILYSACNNTGLFINFTLDSPPIQDIQTGATLATILNATVIDMYGGNITTICAGGCSGVGSIGLNQPKVLNFSDSLYPGCWQPGISYSADIQMWYYYDEVLGEVKLFASGTVSGVAT